MNKCRKRKFSILLVTGSTKTQRQKFQSNRKSHVAVKCETWSRLCAKAAIHFPSNSTPKYIANRILYIKRQKYVYNNIVCNSPKLETTRMPPAVEWKSVVYA